MHLSSPCWTRLACLLVISSATPADAARRDFLAVMARESACAPADAMPLWPRVTVDTEVAFAALGPCVVPEILDDLVHKHPAALAAAIQKTLALGYGTVLNPVHQTPEQSHAVFLVGFRLSFAADLIVMGCEEKIAVLCATKQPAIEFFQTCVSRDRCLAQSLKDLESTASRRESSPPANR